jgi:hypothetical protein
MEIEAMDTQAVDGNSLDGRGKKLNRRFVADRSQRIRHCMQGLFMVLNGRIGIQFSLCGSAILSVEEALSTSRALPASKAAQLRMSIGSGENAESGKPRFFFIRSVSQPAHAEILERRLYGCHLFVRQSPVPSAIRHHAEVMKKKFDPAMAVDEHANRIFGFTKVRYRGIWKSHQWLCAAFALVDLYQHRNRLAPQRA